MSGFIAPLIENSWMLSGVAAGLAGAVAAKIYSGKTDWFYGKTYRSYKDSPPEESSAIWKLASSGWKSINSLRETNIKSQGTAKSFSRLGKER